MTLSLGDIGPGRSLLPPFMAKRFRSLLIFRKDLRRLEEEELGIRSKNGSPSMMRTLLFPDLMECSSQFP